MQSLLFKFVVLTGVIGASCGVVYQAHKEISKAQANNKEAGSGDFAVPADGAELPDAPLANPQPIAGQLDDWHSLLATDESASASPEAAIEPTPATQTDLDRAEPESNEGSLFAGGWPSAAPTQPNAVDSERSAVALASVENEAASVPFGGSFEPIPAQHEPLATPEPRGLTIPAFGSDSSSQAAAAPAPLQRSETPWGVDPEKSLSPLPEGHPGPVLMSPPESELRQAVAALREEEAKSSVQTVASESAHALPLFGAPDQAELEAKTAVSDPFAAGSGVVPTAGEETSTPVLKTANSEEVVPFMPPPAGVLIPTRKAEAFPIAEPKPLREEAAPSALPLPAFGAMSEVPAETLPAKPDETAPWPTIRPRTTANVETAAADSFGGPAADKAEVVPEPSLFRFPPSEAASAEPQPEVAPALTPEMPVPGSLGTIPQRQPMLSEEPMLPEEEVTPEPALANPFGAPPAGRTPAFSPEVEAAQPLTPASTVPTPVLSTVPHIAEPAPLETRGVIEPLNVVEPSQMVTGTGTVPADAPRGPQQPELKIEKIAPKEANLGEPLIYSIVVRNIGGSAAHNVVVEDRIPKGVDAQGVGTSPQAFVTGDKLFWELGTLLPGDERKIQLRVTPIEAGDIGSVATVSFATSVSASIRVTAPKLGLAISGPSEVAVGEQVSYRFSVSNSGEGEARKVFLRMLLPAGVQHPGGNDLEFEVGNLPPGQSRDVELNLMAIASGLVHPEGLVTIDGNVKDKQQVDLNVIEARLALERTGPVKRFIGRPAVYQNIVTNASSETLANVTVSETIPPGVSWTPQPGTNARWDAKTRLVSWTIPQLKAGESLPLSSQIVAEQVGEHAGALTAQDAKGNRADLVTSLAVKGFADLGIDISRPGQPVLVGEQVSMRVSIRNDGTAPAKNVQAAFEIPKGLNFVSAKGPVAYNPVGSMVAFAPLAELAVGQSQEFDIVLTAAEVNTDARVKVHLDTADLETPIQREELIRISE